MVSEAALEAREAAHVTSQHDTFLRFIAQYEPALRRLAGAYVEQTADREDLFQEIAVAIWQAVPRFRGESSERTWLYRIAHNVAISSAAKLRRRGQAEGRMPEHFDHASLAPNGEQEAFRSEKLRLLNESVRGLPAIDRQIILLHLEGLSYAEIEEVSGLSETAVATRLSRIREKLKEKFGTRRPTTNERTR
jgi:RNA polymerase sigma-70 factor (ECF subfamily)